MHLLILTDFLIWKVGNGGNVWSGLKHTYFQKTSQKKDEEQEEQGKRYNMMVDHMVYDYSRFVEGFCPTVPEDSVGLRGNDLRFYILIFPLLT